MILISVSGWSFIAAFCPDPDRRKSFIYFYWKRFALRNIFIWGERRSIKRDTLVSSSRIKYIFLLEGNWPDTRSHRVVHMEDTRQYMKYDIWNSVIHISSYITLYIIYHYKTIKYIDWCVQCSAQEIIRISGTNHYPVHYVLHYVLHYTTLQITFHYSTFHEVAYTIVNIFLHAIQVETKAKSLMNTKKILLTHTIHLHSRKWKENFFGAIPSLWALNVKLSTFRGSNKPKS